MHRKSSTALRNNISLLSNSLAQRPASIVKFDQSGRKIEQLKPIDEEPSQQIDLLENTSSSV